MGFGDHYMGSKTTGQDKFVCACTHMHACMCVCVCVHVHECIVYVCVHVACICMHVLSMILSAPGIIYAMFWPTHRTMPEHNE